jgi:hypothetical protein
MNFLKTLRYVPARVFRAETQAYADRIALNGGSISEASLIAVDKFVGDCKAANIWSKLIEVGPFAGTNLNAALVKLVYQSGGSGVLTNSNFVSGDYVETGSSGGLLGDGTKYLNTGVVATSLPDMGHLSFYLREDVVQTGNRMLMGAAAGGDQTWIGGLIPASNFDVRYNQSVTATGGGAFVKGFYIGTRETNTSLVGYRDGASIATASSLATSTRPSFAMYLWGYNNAGAATARIALRGSFYSMGDSLNATEAAALNTAVRALQLALNRNIN